MRTLLVVIVLAACCTGVLLTGTASAAIPELVQSASVSSTEPQPSEPGSFDPYVGQGDLNTKAVPVCCCSFGFCEDTPNAPCTGGPPVCRCDGTTS